MYSTIEAANLMANTYEQHLVESKLTVAGWDKLSEQFGNVPELLRASVMNDFMRELEVRGHPYDVEVFQQRAKAA